MDIGILVIGFYLIVWSLIGRTKNFKSAFFFKILPFFSGLFLLIYYGNTIGMITLN